MFAQVSAALKIGRRRSGAPIHRHSKLAGRCESGIWRKTSHRDLRQIILAAERYELANKAPGRVNGPLGRVALEILRLLANLVDHKTGRLDPSIETIMHKLRRSRDAIWRGLNALRQHGFVDWLRRFVPVEDAEGQKGPQVKQTSNAYRIVMPQKARACLGKYGAPSPLPEDAEQMAAEREAERQDFSALERLSPSQLDLLAESDNPVARSLARLGKLICKQRESESRNETPPISLFKREE